MARPLSLVLHILGQRVVAECRTMVEGIDKQMQYDRD